MKAAETHCQHLIEKLRSRIFTAGFGLTRAHLPGAEAQVSVLEKESGELASGLRAVRRHHLRDLFRAEPVGTFDHQLGGGGERFAVSAAQPVHPSPPSYRRLSWAQRGGERRCGAGSLSCWGSAFGRTGSSEAACSIEKGSFALCPAPLAR